MVSKGAVIRMLLNSHQLKGVIASSYDSGQNIDFEFPVRADTWSFLSHAYMGLIDYRMVITFTWCRIFPLVCSHLIPNLGAEYFGDIILNRTCSVCGDSFSFTTIPPYQKTIKTSLMKDLFSDMEFPIVTKILKCKFFLRLPVGMFAYKENLRSIGSPLSENPTCKRFMTAEKIITVGKISYIAIRGYSISRIIVCIEPIIELIFKIL